MKRFQESTGDENSTPDSSGLKKYCSHQEKAVDYSENKTAAINYFDRLPDELLVKIFKDTCRYWEGSVFKYYKDPERRYNKYENIGRLAATCKRFSHIINYFVLADIEFAQLACFDFLGQTSPSFSNVTQRNYGFNVMNKPPSWCDYTDEDGCSCQNYRRILAPSKLKYKYLFLDGVDLTRKCIPKLIQDHLTNLDWVVELTLEECILDSVIIDKILTCLPRIEKLSISVQSKTNAPQWDVSSDLDFIYDGPPVRTLSYLQFKFIGRFDRGLAGQLLRHPAKIVDGEFWATESNLGYVRQYLLRHKGIVEHFRLRLCAREESQVKLEYFEGFSVTSARCDWGCFEITSLPRSRLDLDKMMIEPVEDFFNSEHDSDESNYWGDHGDDDYEIFDPNDYYDYDLDFYHLDYYDPDPSDYDYDYY